jgi:hypothetical protein
MPNVKIFKTKRMDLFDGQLQGKKILFIGVKFYDYNEEIIRKLTAGGATVSFFYERDTSILYGIYNRLFNRRLDTFQANYYNQILEKVRSEKFDYLLVIRGHKMPVSFVKEIKDSNPRMVAIMYQWDSNYNSPFINLPTKLNVLPLFDRKFSFDYKDVAEHTFLGYAPTFSTDEFRQLNIENIEKYDFFYFGNYLPERYQGLIAFKEFAERNGYTICHYLYMHWRYYLIERLKGNKLDFRLIRFKKLSRKKYIKLFSMAKAIVDVSNGNQTGMAMRVLDALVAGKKIITTNHWIKKDTIYNPYQIAIIDLKNIELPKDFIEGKNAFPQADFSIDKWISTVFFS